MGTRMNTDGPFTVKELCDWLTEYCSPNAIVRVGELGLGGCFESEKDVVEIHYHTSSNHVHLVTEDDPKPPCGE